MVGGRWSVVDGRWSMVGGRCFSQSLVGGRWFLRSLVDGSSGRWSVTFLRKWPVVTKEKVLFQCFWDFKSLSLTIFCEFSCMYC